MNKYRIMRRKRPKIYGEGSEGYSWPSLVSEIAKHGLGNGRFIRHDDKGPRGTKQLTKDELYSLLKAVAAHRGGNPN
jgi:hypothetical protein